MLGVFLYGQAGFNHASPVDHTAQPDTEYVEHAGDTGQQKHWCYRKLDNTSDGFNSIDRFHGNVPGECGSWSRILHQQGFRVKTVSAQGRGDAGE
ncbi:MAG: hypothetical protein PsegKO_25140 [Pseudohongiellaceae bacterium]